MLTFATLGWTPARVSWLRPAREHLSTLCVGRVRRPSALPVTPGKLRHAVMAHSWGFSPDPGVLRVHPLFVFCWPASEGDPAACDIPAPRPETRVPSSCSRGVGTAPHGPQTELLSESRRDRPPPCRPPWRPTKRPLRAGRRPQSHPEAALHSLRTGRAQVLPEPATPPPSPLVFPTARLIPAETPAACSEAGTGPAETAVQGRARRATRAGRHARWHAPRGKCIPPTGRRHLRLLRKAALQTRTDGRDPCAPGEPLPRLRCSFPVTRQAPWGTHPQSARRGLQRLGRPRAQRASGQDPEGGDPQGPLAGGWVTTGEKNPL